LHSFTRCFCFISLLFLANRYRMSSREWRQIGSRKSIPRICRLVQERWAWNLADYRFEFVGSCTTAYRPRSSELGRNHSDTKYLICWREWYLRSQRCCQVRDLNVARLRAARTIAFAFTHAGSLSCKSMFFRCIDPRLVSFNSKTTGRDIFTFSRLRASSASHRDRYYNVYIFDYSHYMRFCPDDSINDINNCD